MSTVFDLEGVAHWVSHTTSDDQPPDLVKLVAHSYCRIIRIFQRGNALTYDGAPTCLVCIGNHDRFRKAETTARDTGCLERFHHMMYGDNGEPVP